MRGKEHPEEINERPGLVECAATGVAVDKDVVRGSSNTGEEAPNSLEIARGINGTPKHELLRGCWSQGETFTLLRSRNFQGKLRSVAKDGVESLDKFQGVRMRNSPLCTGPQVFREIGDVKFTLLFKGHLESNGILPRFGYLLFDLIFRPELEFTRLHLITFELLT